MKRNNKILFAMKRLLPDAHQDTEKISEIVRDKNTTLYGAISEVSNTDALQVDLSEFRALLRRFNEDVEEFRGAQKFFQTTLDSLGGTVDRLNGSFVDLNASLNVVKEDVKQLDIAVDDNSKQILVLIDENKTYESKLEALDKRVSKLEDSNVSINLGI